VDFPHNTIPMIIQARLLIYINYSKTGYTHKLDRTTVMVGAPSMLAISTILASGGASSSTWAPSGCSTPVVGEGSDLLLSADARNSLATAACCAASGTVTSVMGAGLILLSVAPPCPRFLLPLRPWGRTEKYPATTQDSTVSIYYSIESARLHYSRNSPLGRLIR
jgi:hypothetical protein